MENRVVLGQQIQAVLIHADSLSLGMLGERFMKRLRNPQLELTGIIFIGHRLRYGRSVTLST